MKLCPDVYLIDDDPVFALVAKTLFLGAGARSVEHVENTPEALAALLAYARSQSLLILDLDLYGLDGLAVMRILSQSKFPGFVAISSNQSGSIRESAACLARLLGLRYVGELEKPIRETDFQKLLIEIDHVARQKTAQALASQPLQSIIGVKPVYQSKVDALTGEIVGAESLMRLETSDGSLMSPDTFLEKHTRAGTLKVETLKFLDQILNDMVEWKRVGLYPIISVNAPAPIVEDPEFLVAFARKVRAQGISPSQMTIELTESELPADQGRLIEVLTRLRMSGFGLALDDFGTGMANFDMLRMCPFSELKIDKSLAQACVHDALSCGIVETCARISKELGMTLVAEGIETSEQEVTLKRLGVAVFQGYLFGKGVAVDEFTKALRVQVPQSHWA